MTAMIRRLRDWLSRRAIARLDLTPSVDRPDPGETVNPGWPSTPRPAPGPALLNRSEAIAGLAHEAGYKAGYDAGLRAAYVLARTRFDRCETRDAYQEIDAICQLIADAVEAQR